MSAGRTRRRLSPAEKRCLVGLFAFIGLLHVLGWGTLIGFVAPAHYQLGRALSRLGEHDAARSAFDRARQLNPILTPPGDRDPR